MHAVRPARHRHVQQLQSACLQGGHEHVEVSQQQVGGPGEGGTQRGVDHVGGSQAVVDVGAGRRTDALLHHVDKGGHIVVGDLLPLEHVSDENVVDCGRLGPARGGVVCRHDPKAGLRLGGQQLDLEPEREAGGIAEQRRHVGGGVARDHRALPPRSAPANRRPSGNVVTHLHSLPVDRCRRRVGTLAGLAQIRRHRRHPESTRPPAV